MATKEQIERIKYLRGNGLSQKEIADDVSLSPQMVSVVLKKLASEFQESKPVKLINAVGFEPKDTVIEFTTKDFENYRESDTLYSTSSSVFEMRPGIVHKTTFPEVVPIDTNFSMEDMIAEEEVVLTITHQGYIKRTALNTYRTQRRGGRGVQGAMSKEEDFLEHLFIANTHNYMLFFTDKGKCYWLKVYDIPQGGRAARGRAVVNLIGCEPGERVEAFVSVKEFDDDHYIVMSTRNGIVKKTVLSAYGKPRKGGIYAIDIREGDKLIEARITNGEHDILLGTHEGKSIRFSENNIRPSGRKTMGVKGITLSSKDDYVVGMLVVRREGTILVATEKGYGKRTEVVQYRTQTRGGKGVLTMRCTDKTGKMVNIMEVVDSDDLIVITDSGVLMRQPIADIRTIGRVTQGVRLVKLDDGANISQITRVISEDVPSKEEPPKEDTQLSIEPKE